MQRVWQRREVLAAMLASGAASLGRTVFAGTPKPVPRLQALPLPEAQVSFQQEGVELTRYHYAAEGKRPFLYPVNGPAGRSLTRMGHPRDPETHSHHNSVWISHQSVAGANFWEDRSKAQIWHRRLLRFEDGDDEALVETENAWLKDDGVMVLLEKRRTCVQALPGNAAEWVLAIDLQWEAPWEKPLVLGETAFGPIGVRMAKTIGVNDGGGTIRNSAGGVDEAGCFRKPARWVDYAGPIAPDVTEGIALLDHPANPRHPVAFHVRNDGWMGAALTLGGALEIAPGQPLRLRYALYVHGGMPVPEAIEAVWQRWARSEFREFPEKKKPGA